MSVSLSRLDTLFAQAHEQRCCPGAVVAARSEGRELLCQAFGHPTYQANAPALTTASLFDLASLTKALATTTLLALLYQDRRFDLDDRLRQYLPELQGPGAGLTIRHLLQHRGGYPATIQLCEGAPRSLPSAETQREARQRILDYRPVHGGDWASPGERVRYSDPGFLVLGLLVERLEGCPLDACFQRRLAQPLGLEGGFGFFPGAIPTERRPWGEELRGSVHDENAAWLGGVAGHAGLFGNVADVCKLAELWTEAAARPLLEPEIRALFMTRDRFPGSSRALGWDVNVGQRGAPGAAFGEGFVGHTGFTGVAVWLRSSGEVVALLSNRTWPQRPANSTLIHNLREALWRCLGERFEELR